MEQQREYRAILAADIERSAGRGDAALGEIRQVLDATLREAAERSAIDFDACHYQDSGDGLWLVLPAGTPKSRLLYPLAYELAVRLHARNRRAGDLTRVRIRLALHAGEICFGSEGSAYGRPFEVAARMLDAPPVKSALASSPAVSLVAVLSTHFYEDTVPHGDPGIEPESFRPVSLAVKEYTGNAWLYLPEIGLADTEPPTPQPSGHEPSAHEPPGDENQTRDGALASAAAATGPARYEQNNHAEGNGTVNAVQHGSQHIVVRKT